MGVAKSKSTAVSPREEKSGIFDGELIGTRPTFQDFMILGLLPTSQSYKLGKIIKKQLKKRTFSGNTASVDFLI